MMASTWFPPTAAVSDQQKSCDRQHSTASSDRQNKMVWSAGKSTHLAQLMRDQGRVIALDRTHAKAQQIR